MAEYIESKCRDCFNLAPCAAWIRHGSSLYSDFSYSVVDCPYYVSAADVAPVVRCKDCKYHNKAPCPMRLSFNWTRDKDFCSYGERKDGE